MTEPYDKYLDEPLTKEEAVAYLEERWKIKRSPLTIRSWYANGLDGVYLESVPSMQPFRTSRRLLDKFIHDHHAHAQARRRKNGGKGGGGPRRYFTDAEQQHHDEVEAQLKDMGVLPS